MLQFLTEVGSNDFASVVAKMDFSVLTDNYLIIIGAGAVGIFGYIALKKGWGALVGMFKRA